jgi:hypothetical protein
MVRLSLFFGIVLFVTSSAHAQVLAADILLQHNFEGNINPTDTMLVFPSGDDSQWVNYDQDGEELFCVEVGETPGGWFWEGDLSFADPEQSNNSGLTSCSWMAANVGAQSRNWLISPRLSIPDNNFRLFWKSLSILGPNYVDGYKVLVSETSNIPEDGAFKDTLFIAAETLAHLASPTSLNVSDYIYSPGYIHANAYTDTAYYFIDNSFPKPFFHGKLEPHDVSLAEYAGKNIYVAFFHDTYDNERMQLDDIMVSNATSAVHDLTAQAKIDLFPNPCTDLAYIQWQLESPQAIRVSVCSMDGKQFLEKYVPESSVSHCALPVAGLPVGMYIVTVQTRQGRASKLLVKI